MRLRTLGGVLMTRMKGDTYRVKLTDDEMRLFAERCRGGIRPTDICPLCHSRRLTAERRFGFCDSHVSWEMGSVVVDCHQCEVRYAVMDSKVSACLRATA